LEKLLLQKILKGIFIAKFSKELWQKQLVEPRSVLFCLDKINNM
jgi:hypothetical protein